jgi:GTP-binding protein
VATEEPGAVAFRREGPVTMGGPNGGDGGKGGDVWLVADRNVASLIAFRDHPHRRAQDGIHGKGKDMHGRRGRVARGEGAGGARSCRTSTPVRCSRTSRTRATGGSRRRGRGGRGNAKFLSNRRREPTFAEQGEHGEERWLKLELKLMADVALVGLPERRQEHAHQRHQRGEAEDRELPRSRRSSRTSVSSRWTRTPSSSSPTSRA